MNGSVWLPLLGGLFGAVFGSFLNVCITRWGAEPKQSVVRPRSRCPRCGTLIPWYDNIPVFSWLVLRGRCRVCQEPISPMYPLVELGVALLWGWMLRNGLTLEAVRGAVFGTLLLGIALTDFRAYIIPLEFSVGGTVLGVLFAALSGTFDAVLRSGLGALVGFLLLWSITIAATWVFRRFGLVGGEGQPEEAMGGGDTYMAMMIGSFLGWGGLLLTIFLGALIGTAVFLPIRLLGIKRLVPFGVFLALGGGMTYLVGPAIIAWYRRFLGVA